jgi:hypothetical protein
LLESGQSDSEILDEFYLAALARPAREAERAGLLAHVAGASNRRKAWEDACWAILNSKEFLLRH